MFYVRIYVFVAFLIDNSFSTLFFFRLNHPIKKFKHEEGYAVSVGTSGEAGANSWGGWFEPSPWRRSEDLYAGHNHTKMAPVEPQPCNGSLQSYIKTEIKQEPNQVSNVLIFFIIIKS